MEQAPTQVQERQDTFLETAVKQFAKRGLMLCLVLFFAEVALFFVVSSLPFFPGEKSFYTNQSNTIGTEFQNASLPVEFWGIFSNNYMIAREFIPVLGPILFGASLYATARVLEIISLNDNVSPLIVVLVLLLFFPHSWIELPVRGGHGREPVPDVRGREVAFRHEGRDHKMGGGVRPVPDLSGDSDGDAPRSSTLRVGGDPDRVVVLGDLDTVRRDNRVGGPTLPQAEQDQR